MRVLFVLKKNKHPDKRVLAIKFKMVDCRGLEPRTLGLRVPCSTN